ncbi:metal-dependent hydrolase [Actinopolyspora mortivallis]|uniref:Metal-dependent hydrolase n=1 Tax=Actinopolyspora mortivallis TaxID=33906 RepID=A0A2T0H0B7_ACTMO|nr:metal-dependent hydrolase [Actinopolyspora mortivallis]
MNAKDSLSSRGVSEEPRVEVRRSKRRHRTVSAYRDGDRVVVLLPARMSRSEERSWVEEMLSRLRRNETRKKSPARKSDAALLKRCGELSEQYLDGRAVPRGIRWVAPMRTRWASCTPGEGTIRVSRRLRQVPGWVLDYVLVHELTHLLVPGHGPDFWAWVNRYPRTERAIGYLEGLVAAGQLELDDVES